MKVIGLGGASCVGKTHLTDQLRKKYDNVISYKSPTFKIIEKHKIFYDNFENDIIVRQITLINETINFFFNNIFKNLNSGAPDKILVFDRTPLDYVSYLLTYLVFRKDLLGSKFFNSLYDIVKIYSAERITSNLIAVFEKYPETNLIFAILIPLENYHDEYVSFLEKYCKKKKSRIRSLSEFGIKTEPKINIQQYIEFLKVYYESFMNVINEILKGINKHLSISNSLTNTSLDKISKIKIYTDAGIFPFEWQDKIINLI
jgi:hypothetical protein